jgi:hypothetical protein
VRPWSRPDIRSTRVRWPGSGSGIPTPAGRARPPRTLADTVHTDGHRPIAGDSPAAAGVKVLARAHQTLVWERTRHQLRLRSGLLEHFPAALVAFGNLAARDALELLGRASDPQSAARLTRAQIAAALRRARRRDIDAKTTASAAAADPGADPAGAAGGRVRRDHPVADCGDRRECGDRQVGAGDGRRVRSAPHDAAIYRSQPRDRCGPGAAGAGGVR